MLYPELSRMLWDYVEKYAPVEDVRAGAQSWFARQFKADRSRVNAWFAGKRRPRALAAFAMQDFSNGVLDARVMLIGTVDPIDTMRAQGEAKRMRRAEI
jgi:hypothetical protein